jgi:hypothetical protein
MWSPIDDLPMADREAKVEARSRLWAAMAKEKLQGRRRRTRRRLVVVATAMVLTLGVVPPGLDGEMQPLLGLADAVAASPEPVASTVRHWYARADTRELVTVRVGDTDEIQFLLPAVEEAWHDMGDAPRRTKTFGTPVFLSSEDADAFFAAGLAVEYRSGQTVELPSQPDQYRFASSLKASDAEDLGSVLRRRVGGLGNDRLEEVHLLRLTADLMQVHADDAAMRSRIIAVIADIPGIQVRASHRTVLVSIDYLDGDRALRLMYEFDADSAHLVGEYLAALATTTEPASVLRSARYDLPSPLGVSGS